MDCFLGFDASMLLGALIDAGASPTEIESKLKRKGINATIYVSTTERASITCKKASVVARCAEDLLMAEKDEFAASALNGHPCTGETNALSILAVLMAIEELSVEYIISSELSLGDSTDGTVLTMLENADIEVLPSDGSCKDIYPADVAFLVALANESGPKPPMEIISVGYGAGGNTAEQPNIVNVLIGEFEAENLFENHERELLISSL